jgi:NitT/TauT family transport system substrate-binding protein
MEMVMHAIFSKQSKRQSLIKKASRFFPVVVAGIVVFALAAGCASGGSNSTTNASTTAVTRAEKPNLTVAVVPAVDSAGFFVALYDGLFKAQGLNVHFVPAVSSETAIADQVKGTYDITGGNYVSYIQAQQAGQADLDIFAEGSVMLPGTQALYTMPGSKIRNLNDLVGETIGINAPKNILYLLVASVLASHGIPVNEVHFKDIALPMMAAALKSGQINAAVLPEPFASQAQVAYGVTTLADLNQGATTDFPVQGYVVTRQWAAAYPRTLAAFRRALEQGQEIADTNRTAVERAMEDLPMTPEPLGVSQQTAAVMALDNYPVGPVDSVRLQRVADVMSQFLGFPSFNVTSMIGG